MEASSGGVDPNSFKSEGGKAGQQLEIEILHNKI